MAKKPPDGTIVASSLLRVLILEDNPRDAKLLAKLLEGGGARVEFEVTDSVEVFQESMERADYDVILADFNLRGWTAFDALDILKHSGRDIPLIVSTGSLGDEAAAECIKRGAADFILKDRPARLPAAVQRALEEKRLRTERRRAEEALNEERHLLLTLMDNLPDVIYFKDRESRFTRINKALAKQHGLSDPAQAVSKTDFDFFTAEHAQEAYKDELDIIRTGQPIVGKEEKETWADGHITWVSSTKMPLLDVSGNVTGTFGISRDITGRKRAEESLRESEERFRATFENAGIGMALVDMEGRPFKTNAALRQMLDYSEEELSRTPFTEYTHPDDRGLDWGLYSELTQGKREKYEIEKRFIKKGGGVVWGQLTVSLVKDRNGRPLCAVGMTQDITESKHAEAALRESEERYRTLFERNLAGVFVTTWDGRILDCNQAMANMMGFASPQEALSHRVSDLYVFDEDRAAFLKQLEAEGRLSNYEMRLRRQDGNLVWLMGNISLLPQAATGLRIIEGTLIDITERKLAEAENSRLAQIVNSSDDAIFSSTPEGLIATWNAGAERMFGYSAAEIKGQHFSIMIPEDRRADLAGNRTRLLRGEAIVHYENEHVRKDGSIFPALLTLSPIKDDNGVVTGVSVIARDITERRLAEKALRESEERFRSLVQNATVGIYRTTPESRILMANPSLVKMLGYANFEELSARELGEDAFARGYSRTAFRERIDREGEIKGLETAWTSRDGSVTYVRESARAVRGESGNVLYYDGIVEDITQHKLAEEDLLLKTALLEAQSETTIDGILVVDMKDQILLVNGQFAKMWNLPEGAIHTKDDRKMIEYVRPQIKDIDAFMIKVRYLNSHPTEESRDELELKDGRVFDRYSSPLRGPTGKLYGRIWYFRDITARKLAEAERVRLVTAIEQSTEAVMITNPMGEIEYVNPAFARITGYSREEARGTNPRILKSDRQDTVFYQQLWKTILGGKPWQGELINRRKDGSLYTEEMSITPVTDVHGEVTHFIATKQDVTERRALEAQLQQAAKMEAVGRLAGGVAHDFNNLLTVINGYSEILIERLASDVKGSDYLQEINNAGERAASLTRQLLAFSRRQVLAPQVLSLNLVVSNLEKMLRRLIGEDVKLRTVLDSALARVKADPGQIEQVLMNLAVNARDAMPSGGNLTIETRNVELDEDYTRNHPTVKPGPHVMLAISDTGAGMSPETQAHIFEPFFTTKEQGKGTGLGLATVYGIVKQSEGSIWLYSELGQGTVFKVYFPVVTESPAEREPAKVATDTASGTETILVVEDEEGVRSLVRLALASGGYNVLETEDAENAVALCANHSGPIHLLLTDVVMPQMSGPAVAEKVRVLRPGIKVLYMSGYTDDAVVHHGVLTEDVPFIQKPFSPVALRRKVQEVLGGREEGKITDA